MCGICGMVRFDGEPVDMEKIKLMMFRQKHRGPNDSGTFAEGSTGLGFVRLSILDLSDAGHQPMVDESGRYVMIFNGEIYNYIELRAELEAEGCRFKSKTDTEVLLNMYIRYGVACLDKLNGMFAFVVYDRQTGDFFAARDRFGVKPFYYYADNTAFIFASEIKPVLSVYGKDNEPNEQVIFEYLVSNRTDFSSDTFFKGIKKLQHGHYLTI